MENFLWKKFEKLLGLDWGVHVDAVAFVLVEFGHYCKGSLVVVFHLLVLLFPKESSVDIKLVNTIIKLPLVKPLHSCLIQHAS